MSQRLGTLSHLAVWPGFYVAGSVLYVALVASASPTIAAALVFAFAVGVGTYLIDRAKVRDAWLDPADAAAHPGRFRFIERNAGTIRALAVSTLGAAALIGASGLVGPRWLGLVPVLSGLGVLGYAATPRGRRARPKDVLVLKNAYVACGIAGFACLVVLGAAYGGVRPLVANPLLWGFLGATLCVRVFIDAALCDLDDRTADEAHRTATFPVRLGRRHVLDLATAAHLVLAFALAVVPIGPQVPRLAWATVSAVSAVAFRLASPSRVRDVVDARLLVESLCVALMVWVAL